jgi:hypothetical protein
MSLHEWLEPYSVEPGEIPGVDNQPGVDRVRNPTSDKWQQGHDPRAKTPEGRRVPQVVRTAEGGTWVQNKRLHENAKGTVEDRVRSQVIDACKKFDKPVRNGESRLAETLTDADGNRVSLVHKFTNPDALAIRVEVPGFSQLGPAEQTALQEAAERELKDRLTAYGSDGKYEGLPISVQVVSTPPEPGGVDRPRL